MAFVKQEGRIEIDLADFWEWVAKQHEPMGEITYGVPRINKSNSTLEIDFAACSDGTPSDWAVKPVAVKQWEREVDPVAGEACGKRMVEDMASSLSSSAAVKAPHERGALIERVAKALCLHAYPARSLEEAVAPSRELWMRLIPEAEIAVQAMESLPSATRFTHLYCKDCDEWVNQRCHLGDCETFPAHHEGGSADSGSDK
jgi:hypothetical protein